MPTQMSPLMRSALEEAQRELAGSFRGVFSEETITRVLDDSYRLIGERSTVGPNFMPIFVKKFARERLQAVAQSDGLVAKALPEVLFICVRNAGRSQMAAALAHEISNGQVAVRSAGSDPTEKIHPVVVEAMNELGIDVRMEFPKPLTDEVVRAADIVITLGCGDACPLFPGKRYEDWDIDDPADRPIEAVRRIRYDIHHHVTDLLESLNIAVVDTPDREP
ncbi:MAG TPA: arsenate reductase ArsC [Solirubrobacteraceae bacterium]